MTTLSICILTYNRAAFLPELLDSIIAQNEPDVEVILSDDASSDDTPAVAAVYAGRMPNFRYIRHEQNLGLDKNFLAAVDSASGDYVWLMGDDDRIEPGGIARIKAMLNVWPDVGGLTVGVNDYDVTMTNVIAVRQMPDTQLMHGAGATLTKLADLIGFMSAMVVRRDAWVAIAKDPLVINFHNLYVHVYMMGRIVRQVGTWGVVQEPCVGFRTGNDQFLSRTNWKKRLAIDVLGYDQIAKGILSDDFGAQRAMRRRIFNTHIMSRVRTSKDIPGGDEGSLATAGFLFRYYGDIPEFWSKGLPRALAPSWLIRASRAAYQGAMQKLR